MGAGVGGTGFHASGTSGPLPQCGLYPAARPAFAGDREQEERSRPQISREYSLMHRSLENLPMRATFSMAF